MPKNSYAKRLDAARAVREYAIRRYTRQQMLDFVTIALGRMGYGEKRLKDFEQTLSAVYIEYAKAFSDDLKDDKESAYTRKNALTESYNNTVAVVLSRTINDILRRTDNG